MELNVYHTYKGHQKLSTKDGITNIEFLAEIAEYLNMEVSQLIDKFQILARKDKEIIANIEQMPANYRWALSSGFSIYVFPKEIHLFTL